MSSGVIERTTMARQGAPDDDPGQHPVFEPIAEDALLLRFGRHIDEATSARVLAATALLQEALPELECVPAYASVLLRFTPMHWRGEDDSLPHDRVRRAAFEVLTRGCPPPVTSREVRIPVAYGGAHGPDLAAVAAHAGLSEAAVIARHTAARYRVAMLGFAPGFPYLLGLDPVLAMPRRADPRPRVPAGSVAIGGRQTGIYPRELPGGWQVIGRTPWELFDVDDDPPAHLAPGDVVRFEAVDPVRLPLQGPA
jgi:KipI family sensor histidine kinase inhibitor